MFSDMIDGTLGLVPFGVTKIQAPDHMGAKAKDSLPGSLAISSCRYNVGSVGEFRAASIRSGKIDIITMFFYPAEHFALPIYAMEFVRLGARPIVAVIDAVAPDQERATRAFAKRCFDLARLTRPHLINDGDAPGWFEECRSGWDVFIRPTGLEPFAEVESVHFEVWGRICSEMESPRRRSGEEVSTFVAFSRNYKHHHHVNSPGLPLMNKSFGEAWTGRFMAEWFFC